MMAYTKQLSWLNKPEQLNGVTYPYQSKIINIKVNFLACLNMLALTEKLDRGRGPLTKN